MRLHRAAWLAGSALCVALGAVGCGAPSGGASDAPERGVESGVTTSAAKEASVTDHAPPSASTLAKPSAPAPARAEPLPPTLTPVPTPEVKQPKPDAPPVETPAVVEAKKPAKDADAPKDEVAAPPTGFRVSAPKETVLTKDGKGTLEFVLDMPGGMGVTVAQFEISVPAGLVSYDAGVGASLGNMQGVSKSITASEPTPGTIRVVILGLNVEVIRPGSKVVIPFKVAGERGAAWRGKVTVNKVIAGSSEGDRFQTETVEGVLKFSAKG